MRSIFEKLTVPHPVKKKFHRICATPRFISVVQELAICSILSLIQFTPRAWTFYFNIILPLTLVSSKLSLSHGFPTKIICAPLFSSLLVTSLTPPILLDLLTAIMTGQENTSWSFSWRCLLQSYVDWMLFSTLISQTLSTYAWLTTERLFTDDNK